MTRVKIDPRTLPAAARAEFRALLRKARAATREAIAAWEATRENLPADDRKQPIWADFKRWMLYQIFNGKCAYCEVSLPRHQAHADHFRPKGAVSRYDDRTQKAERVMTTTPDGDVLKHPGYFWLAYDIYNLLPSCAACNTSDWEGTIGKRELFPTCQPHVLLSRLTAAKRKALKQFAYPSTKWPGHYYLRPLDLDAQEGGELIHPLVDDPQEHLKFMLKGIVVGRTLRGKRTISTFKLGVGSLDSLRDRQQQAFEAQDPRCMGQ